MIENNITVPIDPFSPEPLAECYKLRIIGVFCLILFIASFIFNSILLIVFIKYKELRNPLNVFVIALTILNLFGTIFELPWIIVSNLWCRWVFSNYGCIISSFLMYTIGCTSIYLMAAISIERFYVLYKPLSIKKLTNKWALIIIMVCFVNGVLWAFFPLIGWSHYSLEGALTSCSVEWKEKSLNVTSYNITIFLVVFMLPVLTIITTNIKLVLIVKKVGKFNRSPNGLERSLNKQKMERNVTVTMMLIVFEFLIAWVPYALVSLYSAFINSENLPPLLGTIPAIFAKSSMLWTSILYIFANKKIRSKLTELINITFKNSDEQSDRLSRSIMTS